MNTPRWRRFFLAAVIGSASLFGVKGAAAANHLTIGLITSASGGASSLGIPYRNGVMIGYDSAHEINGRRIELIQLDDASDPTKTDLDARKLITESHVDAIIGAATTPGTLALASVASRDGVPVIALAPTHLSAAQVAWTVTIPQPVSLMVEAIVQRMKKDGVKSLGMIGFSDAAGDLFAAAIRKSAAENHIAVVADERFARTDTSVVGQILSLKEKHPDAIVDSASGTPAALPILELRKVGYDVPVYGMPPMISKQFVRIVGKAGNGVIAATGPFIVADQLPNSNPIRAVALQLDAAYKTAYGEPPDSAFASYAYDAWLTLVNAAKRVSPKLDPGTKAYRAALRDAIYATRDLVGSQAVYNFHPGDSYGVDMRSLVIVKLQDGKWVLDP